MDQICIALMMVINLKHLESSKAESLLLLCFKLLHNGACCSSGNVMMGNRRRTTFGEIISLKKEHQRRGEG